MRLRFEAVGMNVARGQRQGRIRGQEPAGFGWKDVGVAPDLVNGPGRSTFVCAARIPLARHEAGIRHVVEHITSAYCFGRTAFRDVVNFSDLDSRHVPVFGEARWNQSHVSPPIRSRRGNRHLFGFQHQVRFTDRPPVRVVETEGWRHVGRIATRRPGVHPFHKRGDLLVAQ